MKKLFIGITAENSVDLIIGQLNYYNTQNFNTYLLAPDTDRVKRYCESEKISHIPISIERNISPLKDLITLISLIRIFKSERPDIINLGTPKMSLLGMLAGKITRVPYRIYTCRGYRFEHESGALKKLLIFFEKVISACSHRVYCISRSVRDLGVHLNLFPIEKTRLIAKGSSNGVDLELFNKSNISEEKRNKLKLKLGLNQDVVVFGFVGRLVDRKGLNEMFYAFDEVYQQNNNVALLVIGRPFWDQISDPTIIERFNNHPGIIMEGFQPIETIPYYLSIMDIFLLPAKWEGFGNVLIQAAAMGVPILATKVTGVMDAVSNGYNGVLVENGNHEILVAEMNNLALDENRRKEFGENGVLWSKHFHPEIIWKGYVDLYNESLN